MNSKLMSKVRKAHRWLALIVGIQLLLWTVSGLYMTAVPLHMVHGKHLISQAESTNLADAGNLYPIANILQKHTTATSIQLTKVADNLVYIAKEDGVTHIYDAVTGLAKLQVSQDKAKQIAQARYTGKGQVVSVVKIEDRGQAPELGGRALPMWQVNFDDWVNTSVYVSANVEKVETVRSDIWRIFDFLWMLHIMDYSERENFNNPLVIFMSTLGCFIALSGIIMFVSGMKKTRRYLR